MNIRTRKYQLETSTYIKTALVAVLKEQWWVGLIYLGICAGYLWIPNWWWIIGASIALVLYILFWLIQFAGVTQLEQGKILFQKLSYEINSQQILIKLNSKQGMPMKWDQIKRAQKGKDAFVLFVSKAQVIHLPFRIFNSENEIKFLESVLKRKGYLKQ
ncbi:MAG: YcxB family protein [Cytophagales bacterium]|nr:YcxB family protein [Cytophagales bacterium]